jgi:cysteine synthase A
MIIEATSGNTGISFSAIGRALGHPVTIFMPDWMSAERIALIRSFGATIRLVSKEEGGFLGSIALAEELARGTPGAFLPRQFANELNCDAHLRTTGPEIWAQLRNAGLSPDAFVAGVGTGGTIMGTGRYLRGMRPDIRLHPVEPANSPTLTTGHKVGKHRIQGIGAGFKPDILDMSLVDEVMQVTDEESMEMAPRIAREEGIICGISCGAAMSAALKIAARPEAAGKTIVVILPDSGERYLSSPMFDYAREMPTA